MAAEIRGLGDRPLIMCILNVTPDSFSDGGKFFDTGKAVDHAVFMAESGADIIDVGGESSRPGAEAISVDEEIKRVVPVVKRLRKKIDIPISVDTIKSEVAKSALGAGATIINFIGDLRNNAKIAEIVAEHKAYLVLMHMRGNPKSMQENTRYDDLIGEISSYLDGAASRAIDIGVSREKIIIDPGIGFGKSVDGNFSILKNLDRFLELGYPLMVGPSRKSFIGKAINLDVGQRLEGSLAAACYAVLNGADIVRVHDVPETRKALTIIEKIVTVDGA